MAGIIGPQLFGRLIPTGKTSDVFFALAVGSILMIVGGVIEIAFGVKAERRGLESIAKPLTAVSGAVSGGVKRAGSSARGGGDGRQQKAEDRLTDNTTRRRRQLWRSRSVASSGAGSATGPSPGLTAFTRPRGSPHRDDAGRRHHAGHDVEDHLRRVRESERTSCTSAGGWPERELGPAVAVLTEVATRWAN